MNAISNPSQIQDDAVDEEYDKSSSIREFEKLEKMVEVEEAWTVLASKKAVGGEHRGAGEPAHVGKPPSHIDPNYSDNEEDDEDESEMSLSPPVVIKQNAFPTTTGFSLSSSVQPIRQSGNKVQRARRSASNRINTRDNTTVEIKAPGPESGKKKVPFKKKNNY